MICDFCSSPDPRFQYPCPDFTLPMNDNYAYASEGAWAACDECAVLVDLHQWEALWERFCKLRRMSPGSAASRPHRIKALATWSRFAELHGQRQELAA